MKASLPLRGAVGCGRGSCDKQRTLSWFLTRWEGANDLEESPHRTIREGLGWQVTVQTVSAKGEVPHGRNQSLIARSMAHVSLPKASTCRIDLVATNVIPHGPRLGSLGSCELFAGVMAAKRTTRSRRRLAADLLALATEMEAPRQYSRSLVWWAHAIA